MAASFAAAAFSLVILGRVVWERVILGGVIPGRVVLARVVRGDVVCFCLLGAACGNSLDELGGLGVVVRRGAILSGR